MSESKTIFKRIIDGEIPAKIVMESDYCLAFEDVSPQAPVHVLVIPKEEIKSLAELTEAHQPLMGKIMLFIKSVAEKLELSNGYRVITNIGEDGGQSVPHLHFHILGKRALKWPPG